jgi:hypothetical protein
MKVLVRRVPNKSNSKELTKEMVKWGYATYASEAICLKSKITVAKMFSDSSLPPKKLHK